MSSFIKTAPVINEGKYSRLAFSFYLNPINNSSVTIWSVWTAYKLKAGFIFVNFVISDSEN